MALSSRLAEWGPNVYLSLKGPGGFWCRLGSSPHFPPLGFFGRLPDGELARHSVFFLTLVSGQWHAKYREEE